MKQYIKTLLFGLFLGAALVSCNDPFEEGGTATYPAAPELGIYKNEYTAKGANSYTISLTLNEEGDTVCTVTQLNTASGRSNVFSEGKLTYDKATGVMQADYEESPFESPARVALVYKANGQIIVNIYASPDGQNYSVRDSYIAVKADAISFLGDWQLADGNVLSLSSDGKAEVNNAEGKVKEGTFTVEGMTTTVTFSDGSTVVLTADATGRPAIQENGGEAYYGKHITTRPRNDWYEYALGNYVSWLWDYDENGNPVPRECVLEYSPSRGQGRIMDAFNWLGQGNETSNFTFTWEIGETSVSPTLTQYYTGYNHRQSGQNLGYVYGCPATVSSIGASATFVPEENTFYFGIAYQIPGVGGFGTDIDTYTITGLLVD